MHLACLDYSAGKGTFECASVRSQTMARLGLGNATRFAELLVRAWARRSLEWMTGAIHPLQEIDYNKAFRMTNNTQQHSISRPPSSGGAVFLNEQ